MIQLHLQPCLPAAWTNTGHVQTILGHLLPSPLLPDKGERFEVSLPDGDRLVAFLKPGRSQTVVYLFHGLAGSTDSTYIHRVAQVALNLGHSVIMMNHRGCGEGAGLAKAPYHSGRGEDLSAIIAYGKRRFPSHAHLAVGFSLSGNALLLLMSGDRGETQPDFAIAVNAPIDLADASAALNTGLNRIYDVKFFLQCRRDVWAGQAAPEVKRRIPRLTTLANFDSLYTAPLGGFKNREDYYESCSTWYRLTKIKNPTVILTTLDDPFVRVKRYLEAKLSPEIRLHIEKFGGHMGYIARENTPLGNKRWMDYAIHEAIQALAPRG